MNEIKRKKGLGIYFGIIIFSILFLFVGNKIATHDIIEFKDDDQVVAKAKISNIVEVSKENWGLATIIFEAQILSGIYKGRTVTATKLIDDASPMGSVDIKKGDKVLLIYAVTYIGSPKEWHYLDHERLNNMILFGLLFVVLLLLFGRSKGFNALLALGFTTVAIFAVFVPSIFSGKNIYLSSIITCLFSIVITLFLLNGINKKSITAVIGCMGGVIIAGLVTLIMNNVLRLSGWTSSESMHLAYIPTETPIDLRAIIFSGIIIGAVGAIMDVAVSISAALWELKEKAKGLTFHSIFSSGINIGKDIMGSMTNTLVLAYIGSSLTIILLLIVYASSFMELFNRELVIVEFLQALIGSLGILLTMPLTALVCAVLYSRSPDIDS